jgi:hypothetical protein
MSAFMQYMEPPEGAQKVNLKATDGTITYTWSYTYEGQTITYYWTYADDATKNYYTMQIQLDDGPLYNYVEAWEMKDGSKGKLLYNFNWIYAYYDDYYEDYYDDLFYTYEWEVTSSGVYNFTFYYGSESGEYTYALRYDVVVNADGSGTIDYYYEDELFWHMEWDAMGNGSWAYYDTDGTVYSSGTWDRIDNSYTGEKKTGSLWIGACLFSLIL